MRKISGVKEDSHNNSKGSPTQSEPVFLAIGILRKPHGVNGEIYLEVLTDFPERIQINRVIYAGEKQQKLIVKSVRGKAQGLLLSFDGIKNLEKIQALRNTTIYVRSDELPDLKPAQYYQHQIIGLSVVDVRYGLIGRIIDIQKTGANDVYIIKPINKNQKEILLPAIKSVIKNIDLINAIVIVVIPELG